MANILATSIRDIPHLAAFDQLAKDRFEAIDLTVLMLYVVDTAPASALYYLAQQFNVLGWKGWVLATTEDQQRALVKKAIELNRHKGTPWAIVEAIKALGFDGAEIKEGVGVYWNGQYVFDGTINWGSASDDWATFRATILLPSNVPVGATDYQAIRNLILAYKNARSHLIDISFRLEFSDQLAIDDQYLEFDNELIDQVSQGIYFNGANNWDGSPTFGHTLDAVDLTVFDSSGNFLQNDQF